MADQGLRGHMYSREELLSRYTNEDGMGDDDDDDEVDEEEEGAGTFVEECAHACVSVNGKRGLDASHPPRRIIFRVAVELMLHAMHGFLNVEIFMCICAGIATHAADT
jgi:hypothetical protein